MNVCSFSHLSVKPRYGSPHQYNNFHGDLSQAPGPHLLLLLMYRRRSSARPLFFSTAVLLRFSWSRTLRKSSSSVSSCSRARDREQKKPLQWLLLQGLAQIPLWTLQHPTINPLVPRGGFWDETWQHVDSPAKMWDAQCQGLGERKTGLQLQVEQLRAQTQVYHLLE